jgi:prepilin peptidase CpaA
MIFAIIISALLLVVVYYDVTQFIIPNWVSVLLVALFFAYYFTASPEIKITESIAVMLITFLVGLAIFTLNIMGGGDVKLITAISLWIGFNLQNLSLFYISMALFGGAVALFYLIYRKALKSHNKEIPYGVAIAAAFAYLIWNGNVISM